MGSLANTYVIWGHAVEASAFVTLHTGAPRSIAYSGPVEPESVHFTYADAGNLGRNSFVGQPDWVATEVTSITTDMPY